MGNAESIERPMPRRQSAAESRPRARTDSVYNAMLRTEGKKIKRTNTARTYSVAVQPANSYDEGDDLEMPTRQAEEDFENYNEVSSACWLIFCDKAPYVKIEWNGQFRGVPRTQGSVEGKLLMFIRNAVRAGLWKVNDRDPENPLSSNADMIAAVANVTRIIEELPDTDSAEFRSFACLLANSIYQDFNESTFEKKFNVKFDWLLELREKYARSEDEYWELVCRHYKDYRVFVGTLFHAIRVLKNLKTSRAKNVYRLAHCKSALPNALDTNCSDFRELLTFLMIWFLSHSLEMLAICSFLVQFLFAWYVVFSTTVAFLSVDEPSYGVEIILVVVLQIIYTFPLVCDRVSTAFEVRKIFHYHGISIWLIFDIIINGLLPIVLYFVGCLLVLMSDSILFAVLRTTALLWIPTMDERLLSVLPIHANQIITDFAGFTAGKLISKFMFLEPYVDAPKLLDIWLHKYPILKPCLLFELQVNEGVQSISNVSSITRNCLFSRFDYVVTNNGIPYLKFWRLGEEEGNEYKTGEDDSYDLKEIKTIEGCFVVTSITASDRLAGVRICWAPNTKTFLKAMSYYGLWEVTWQAHQLLTSRHANLGDPGPQENRYPVPAKGVFLLRSCKTDTVLDAEFTTDIVVDSFLSSGGEIRLSPKTGGDSQLWKLVACDESRPEEGCYVENYLSGLVLSVKGSDPNKRANVHLWENIEAPNQKWRLTSEGFLESLLDEQKEVSRRLVLDIRHGTADGLWMYQKELQEEKLSQKWEVVKYDSFEYYYRL